MTEKKNRIFWLGMHVVLTATELPRLRKLGFEVFNPPYNSNIYDQSANLNWDSAQPTTLPKIVFNILSKYNFFYNQISEEIAEILNEYFDTVIVTINPDWLESVLRVFKGRVIYRTYGQPYSISDALMHRKLWKNIIERDNFHFVPFAEETISDEHQWLCDRSHVVPYTLPLDTFGYKDTWQNFEHLPEIMVSVPNIKNSYYKNMYNHLNVHFPEMHYRFYGVQPEVSEDLRVVGTLQRPDVLRAYQRSRGYFYPYHEHNVCYLPPIEMMTVGGPIVFHKNSLLHRFFKTKAPGMAEGIADQRTKVGWLLKGDSVYVDEVIRAQNEVRHRYAPEYVDPIFDATFTTLLGKDEVRHEPILVQGRSVTTMSGLKRKASRVWVLAHFPGQVIRHDRGHPFASEGIPRVIAKVIEGLMGASDHNVSLTCYSHSVAAMHDLFATYIKQGRLALHVLDSTALELSALPAAKPQGEFSVKEEQNNFDAFLRAMNDLTGGSADADPLHSPIADSVRRQALVHDIASSDDTAAVMVPHYYLFPEALLLDVPIVLYLPDYTPHFFNGIPFDRSLERDAQNAVVGRRLAEKAKVVLTNSEFTKEYLPLSILKVPEEKIRCLPMPLLVGSTQEITRQDREALENRLGGRQYIFYPTANRPNKQIAFLLKVFAEVRREFPDLHLVLTCSLGDYAPAQQAFAGLDIEHAVSFLPGINESMMRWLYENASLLCLTSTMEGNFPPQILEALHYGTPVVATRLPHIVEILGEQSDLLSLAAPLSFFEFAAKVSWALSHGEEIREAQDRASKLLERHNNMERFGKMISALFGEAASDGVHLPVSEPARVAVPAE